MIRPDRATRADRLRVRRARGGLVAAALLAVLALTGCIGIPTAGGVQSGPIETGGDDGSLIDIPEGPAAGATPEEIIEGFLRAGRGPQDRYSVAREYLTTEYAGQWSPTEQVRISGSTIQPVPTGSGSYEVTVTVTALVDASGRYSEQTGQQTLAFELVQEGGEYRIASAPPGTMLPRATFDNVFGSYPLYFFDPTFRYLVPDLRWFPRNTVTATRIVSELLGGPTSWLASGVLASAFPEGTALTEAVAVEGGTASVPLNPEVGSESATTQTRMLQQLRASLNSLGNVTSADITVDGFGLDVPEGATQPDTQFQVGLNAVGQVGGRFGELTGSGVVELAGYGGRVADLEPRAASVQRGRDAVAVLAGDGVWRVPAEGDALLLDTRAGLVAPTTDPEGFVWSVPADDPQGLIAFGADGSPHPVPLDVDGRITAIELSRDGSRLLVALDTASGSRLFVAGVVRDQQLEPVGLGAAFDLPYTGEPVDVAWADAGTVAVLSRLEEGVVVNSIVLGGRVAVLGVLSSGVQIVGGNNGVEGLRLLDAGGAVLRPTGSTEWGDTGLDASFLATQQ